MRGFLIFAALVMSAVSADAQWMFHKKESSTGGAPLVVAVVGGNGGFLAFRCGADGVLTVYQTNTPASAVDLAQRLDYGPLMLRPDSGEVRGGDASPDLFEGKLQISAQLDGRVLAEVAAAKTRLAVAVDIAGEIKHQSTFPIKGAKEVLGQFIQACPVASQY